MVEGERADRALKARRGEGEFAAMGHQVFGEGPVEAGEGAE